MLRRTFIKSVAGILAGATVAPFAAAKVIASPVSLPNGWDRFNPEMMYGERYVIADFMDAQLLRECHEIMASEIRYIIPPAYRHKVTTRWENPKPNDYDPLYQRGYFFWVYKPY